MSVYFVAGTGTGVGKTFTTCALIHAARTGRYLVRAHKPVVTGYSDGDPNTDTARIIKALGILHDEKAIEKISPWRYAEPLSPHLAAVHTNQFIDTDGLIGWTNVTLEKSATFEFIETVGGVMVPLNYAHTTRDWMAAVGAPVILVTGSYLGSLSHTLTAMESLRAVRLPIAAVIVSESEKDGVDLQEMRGSIAAFATDVPVVIAQPRVADYTEATDIHGILEQLHETNMATVWAQAAR